MTTPLVTVTPYGRGGASARVRVFDWLDHLSLSARTETYLGLSTAGLADVVASPRATLAAEVGLRRLAREINESTVLLCRNASSLSAGRIEATLLSRASHGVYDVDDALMEQHGTGLGRLFARSSVWRRSVSAADVVIAGNELLADVASHHARKVVVIPSCVEPSTYVLKSQFEIGERGPRAVWLGSPSTEQYLELVAEALVAEHRRSGLRLRVISRGSASLGVLDEMVDRVEWSLDGFAAALVDAEVGLMPLPDEPWARGKCAYKLLQYGAAGMPMIGSPVGANKGALAAMGGTAASSLDEWSDALAEVVTASSAERAARGAAAREGVDRDYSFAAWADEWARTVLGI